MSAVEARLAELGLSLPEVVPPLAAYCPAVRSGRYVHTAGQLPMVDGELPLTGNVGAEVTADVGVVVAPISRTWRVVLTHSDVTPSAPRARARRT